jgi:hypothetical protein
MMTKINGWLATCYKHCQSFALFDSNDRNQSDVTPSFLYSFHGRTIQYIELVIQYFYRIFNACYTCFGNNSLKTKAWWCLPLRRPGFNLRTVYVGLVMEKVTGDGFPHPRILQLSPVSKTTSNVYSFFYKQSYLLQVIDSVAKEHT